jgi:tripartite-type tricarboxylate transporter receptor subunit TctC
MGLIGDHGVRYMRPTCAVAAALLLAAPLSAVAQPAAEYPVRAVRIVVPYSVGLGPDVVMRRVAEKLAQQWGQPVLIDNRPGGSGVVALSEVKRAAADGHELFLGDAGALAVMPWLYRRAPYEPVRDFVPVSTLFRATMVLWTGAGRRHGTLAELLAAARARPREVSFASLGPGSPTHLVMDSFERAAGVSLLHVPFKDGGQMIGAVANGDVDMMPLSVNSAAGPYKAGRLRPLAVGTGARLRELAAVPTLAEAGGPAIEMTLWAALMAVAGTPASTVERIHAAVVGALGNPDVRGRIEALGFEVLGSTPTQLAELIRSDTERYRPLVRSGAIRID